MRKPLLVFIVVAVLVLLPLGLGHFFSISPWAVFGVEIMVLFVIAFVRSVRECDIGSLYHKGK